MNLKNLSWFDILVISLGTICIFIGIVAFIAGIFLMVVT